MRQPVYQFIVTQDFRTFALIKNGYGGAAYRRSKFSTLFGTKNAVWRSLTLTETMHEFEPGRFFITHVSVDACHCDYCGAQVEKPCRNKSGRPTKQVHWTRKALLRHTLKESN